MGGKKGIGEEGKERGRKDRQRGIYIQYITTEYISFAFWYTNTYVFIHKTYEKTYHCKPICFTHTQHVYMQGYLKVTIFLRVLIII